MTKEETYNRFQPRFKVGDVVKHIDSDKKFTVDKVTEYEDGSYNWWSGGLAYVPFKYELVVPVKVDGKLIKERK